MITEKLLIEILPASKKVASIVAQVFNENSCTFEINNPKRVAAFIAQTAWESNSFTALREYASGSAYEGRKDLGNIFQGDGKKFKGRGYIQITGRSNYRSVSKFLFGDERLLDNPDLLATPKNSMLSAMWYWQSRNLNHYADLQYYETITKRINGGLNHFAERITIYNKFCKEFGLAQYDIVSRDIFK